ncbi:SDR family NAD(P)-dependent oxidoreductase [Lucifera butyrica]|nr:SDR family oxidoreductase [Lucifera butyrica]
MITGASTGIGYELAKLFAQDKYNLVIVGRNKQRLTEVAEEFTVKYSCSVTVIQKDLSNQNAAIDLFHEVSASGFEFDILVNNAGIGSCGQFHETDLCKNIEMIELNITSLTILTKLVSAKMVTKGGGKILNVASTGAYMPGPYFAVYYASKAYVLSFSEAIANELRDFGVVISVLCPGATISEFANRAGKTEVKNAMSAKTVANVAYKGLMNNERIIIPGLANKCGVLLAKLMPRQVTANIIGKVQKKLFEDFRKDIKNNRNMS